MWLSCAGHEANMLEEKLGVPVLRHREKKPAGGPEDLENHFGCSVEKLIMVGDRYLTDIVFGNRLGMLTIRPGPYTTKGETRMVRAVRKLEDKFVKRRYRKGVQAPEHPLISREELTKCVR